MPKLKHFKTWGAVSDYVDREIVDTLRDDLDRMEYEEKAHYTASDRNEMRRRIGDIEALQLHFPHVLRVTQAEHSAILAGLRIVQQCLETSDGLARWGVEDIASNGEQHPVLGIADIDNLCERIN